MDVSYTDNQESCLSFIWILPFSGVSNGGTSNIFLENQKTVYERNAGRTPRKYENCYTLKTHMKLQACSAACTNRLFMFN